jgi:hypothetical protein
MSVSGAVTDPTGAALAGPRRRRRGALITFVVAGVAVLAVAALVLVAKPKAAAATGDTHKVMYLSNDRPDDSVSLQLVVHVRQSSKVYSVAGDYPQQSAGKDYVLKFIDDGMPGTTIDFAVINSTTGRIVTVKNKPLNQDYCFKNVAGTPTLFDCNVEQTAGR